ncbi:uncharacterized protein LOC135149621 [Daucus carota subsp. sativus]|uniref:uncharacterized protein LOC135149621 n=1 Tax=Daucus carota subsp. sativus TaxID=79200 RepID=UPI003083A4C4
MVKTNIWKVPWLPCPLNGYLTTIISVELKDKRVVNLLDESKKAWDEDLLQDICNERDRELIRKIPIPRSSKVDSWFLFCDDKGEFSVKTCYRLIRGERECLDKMFWKKLWGLNLPGKVTNFLWRSCRKVLPTAAALRVKHVNISAVCSWCQSGMEDDRRVLFQCNFSREFWEKVGLADVVKVVPGDTVMSLLKRVFRIGRKEQYSMVGLLCWNLWHRRNNWVWNNVNTSSFGVCSRTIILVDAVNGRSGQSYFHTIVDDCKDILKHFSEVLVVFSSRSANTVAHLLATATYSMSGLHEWLATAQDFIACNISSEEAS